MNTSDVLNLAADLIEERGWARGGGWHPEHLLADAPLCAEGALKAACMADEGDVRHWTDLYYGPEWFGGGAQDGVLERVKDYLGEQYVFSWNDRPERTASEVVGVLRAAAVVEAARESQPSVAVA